VLIDRRAREHFRTFGFVVIRRAFDAGALCDEVDRALHEGSHGTFQSAVARGRYVPMMGERTPVSLGLLDQFTPVAADLLGAPVLPVRAKCVRYAGSTGWHSDSDRPLDSIGFAAYLEALDAGNGALRVLPGSHRPEFIGALREHDLSDDVDAVPGFVVASEPGDVIVLDEHLYHASDGGVARRQWRVDYVIDPVGEAQEAAVLAFYAAVYPADWDGGYDADAYPTYGRSWLESGRPYLRRLTDLGAHAAATAQEAGARR